MAPGARNKFGAPTFEPEVFVSKCAVEESARDIVGTFRPPCPPHYASALNTISINYAKSMYLLTGKKV